MQIFLLFYRKEWSKVSKFSWSVPLQFSQVWVSRKNSLTVRRQTPSHMGLKFVACWFQINVHVPRRVYRIFIWIKMQ